MTAKSKPACSARDEDRTSGLGWVCSHMRVEPYLVMSFALPGCIRAKRAPALELAVELAAPQAG